MKNVAIIKEGEEKNRIIVWGIRGKMGEEDAAPPPPTEQQQDWLTYISEDLPRTVQESADSAISSARSLQQSSSTHLRSLQVTNSGSSSLSLQPNDRHALCRNLFPKSELGIGIMRKLSSPKLKVSYLEIEIQFIAQLILIQIIRFILIWSEEYCLSC